MPPIPGSVRLTGFLAPTDSSDTYAVTDDTYNRGGYKEVATAVDRLAITPDRRKEGMLVYQIDTGEFWMLIGGIGDINWVLATFSGGGGGIDPDPTQWSVNRIDNDVIALPPQAPPGVPNLGTIYFSPTVGTFFTTEFPYYRCDLNVGGMGLVAGRMYFGRPMGCADHSHGATYWIAEIFGWSTNNFVPNFANLEYLIGWKEDGDWIPGTHNYIAFQKKIGDLELYASMSSPLGFHDVDTGIALAPGSVNKLEIYIDPVIQTAYFYVDDILVATITSDDSPWPDTGIYPWQCYIRPQVLPNQNWSILYQLPWFVAMKK